MTINVPPDVEKSILAAVQSGRFPSVDAAITTAWLEWNRTQVAPPPRAGEVDPDPDLLLGLWSEHADETDEIVADAYRQRRAESWRELDL